MKKNAKIWSVIWQKISQSKAIKIYRHVHPDPDAYGAQYGLAMVIKANFPKIAISCEGEKVERLQYLFSAFENDVITEAAEDCLHIVVDTANTARIDGTLDVKTLEDKIIKIDHHPNIEAFGSIVYVVTDTPATSSLLLQHFVEMETQGEIKLPKVALESFYAGIIGDTGNFSYGVGMDKEFFQAIAVLFERVNTKELLARFFEKTLEEIKFKGYLQSQIQIGGAGFYFVEFTSDVADTYGVSVDYATGLVNILSEVKGAKVWASFCEDKHLGTIRCSLRSRYLEVAPIAIKYGGGGHPQAAGIRVDTWDTVEKIKKDIKELLANNAQ